MPGMASNSASPNDDSQQDDGAAAVDAADSSVAATNIPSTGSRPGTSNQAEVHDDSSTSPATSSSSTGVGSALVPGTSTQVEDTGKDSSEQTVIVTSSLTSVVPSIAAGSAMTTLIQSATNAGVTASSVGGLPTISSLPVSTSAATLLKQSTTIGALLAIMAFFI